MSRLLRPSVASAAMLALVGAWTAAAWAQDVEEVEESEYSYGTVLQASADHLVVQEYDFETGATSEVAYRIDPRVMLHDVNTVTDIRSGDGVDIDYVVQSGQRIAKVISVERVEQPLDVESLALPDEASTALP